MECLRSRTGPSPIVGNADRNRDYSLVAYILVEMALSDDVLGEQAVT
jgi:hypothetical protein